MKKVIILIFVLMLTIFSFGQKTEFLNYKLNDDGRLQWQKIYESELSIDELESYFKSIPFTAELDRNNDKLMGRSNKTKISNEKGTSMMARQMFTVFVTIDAKEDKYRVTLQDLLFDPIETSVYSGGLGISSDVSGTWEDVSVRNKHHEIRMNDASKRFLTTLQNDLNKVFKIQEVKDDW